LPYTSAYSLTHSSIVTVIPVHPFTSLMIRGMVLTGSSTAKACQMVSQRPALRIAQAYQRRRTASLMGCPFNLSNSVEDVSSRSRGTTRPSCGSVQPSSLKRGRREDRVSADTRGPRAARSTRQNHRSAQ
jgi:hypothetical protein